MPVVSPANQAASALKRASKLPFQLSSADLLRDECYVNGSWVPAQSGHRFAIYDPGTEQAWASCPDCAAEDVNAAVESAHAAFQLFSRTQARQRADLLQAWHQEIVSHRDDLARILVHETGKPLAEAYGEIDYGLTFVQWFTGEAERVQGTVSVGSGLGSGLGSGSDCRRVLTTKQPIGVAAALVPWNFPLALVLRKVSTALAAGCTVVVKPSPETPLTALCLAHLAAKAGYAPGVFNVLTTSASNTPLVSEALCLHPLVKKVTFTGSTRVGRIVAGLCAQSLTRSTLELGGNCPFIVFADADLDAAAASLTALKWRHAGQACITANRVYVQAQIYDTFVDRLVQDARRLRLGHGMDENTTLGPVTTARSLSKVEEIAADAVAKGANMVLGTGKRVLGGNGHDDDDTGASRTSRGYFMAPIVLANMADDMLLSREEVFGPLLGVYKFETEDEVVARANDTSLGLASYVFTRDIDRLWRMFESLEAGMIGLVRHPLQLCAL